jgi:hypothetical protein
VARAGSAASISTTIGAAAATLLVVGAILVWPSASHCAAESEGWGTCLRNLLSERGLPEPDAPVEPLQPPAGPSGRLEARADEPAAPKVTMIEIAGSPARLNAAEIPVVSPASPQVALAPAAPELAVVAVPAAPTNTTPATLNDPAGALSARGADAPPAVAPPTVLSATAPKMATEPVLEVMEVPRFDPAYPNVLVLPLPNGDNSSVRTLTLD